MYSTTGQHMHYCIAALQQYSMRLETCEVSAENLE
jgi:hypothetical protein